MLMYLCSYSQDLYVRNDSAFTITVSGFYETILGNCNDGSGTSGSIAPGTVGTITYIGTEEWMIIRVVTDPIPGYSTVGESHCSDSCGSSSDNGLTQVWNGCYEVTIF